MSPKNTADKVWAALNVSSIGVEFNQEQNATPYTNGCTVHPCGTGYCNTRSASNCGCIAPN